MNDVNKNQLDSEKNKGFSFDQLVVEINDDLTTHLSDLITKLLDSAQEELFNISNEADNNEIQTRYFELTNQVRTLKTTIIENFSDNFNAYLLPANEFENKQNENQLSDDGELSLVNQEDMDGIVLVKGIGERSAAKYSDQLSQLKIRFDELAKKTSHIFKSDALVPTNICQAFDDALANEFDSENKKILFALFDTDVASKLDDLYDSINTRLIDAGILPTIKLHVTKQASSSTAPTKHTQQAVDSTEENHAGENTVDDSHTGNTDGGSNISGFAMTAAPGGNYRAAQQGSSTPPGNYQAAQQGSPTSAGNNQANNHAANNNFKPGNSAGSDSTEYQHYTAGMPASQVGQVLSNYIGAPFSPEDADTPSVENTNFYPQSTNQHFGHQEIIQALSSIQAQPEFNQTDGVRLDGEHIKQAVLEAIAKTSGGAVTKRINQIAEKTIDFIELIFDAIIDDKEITDTIKTLLLRLQIPIIKASMSDQQFFIYDEHPARVLLDTIADVSVGVIEHTDDVYKFLDKIITNILAEYDLKTETFQTALDDLNAYTEEKDAASREKEEAEQKQILRKHARSTVLKSLRAATTGKTLPEDVHALILKRWPTLMFNHYLSNGKENDEWVNIVLTLRLIVESVQIITSAEHLAKILASKDELFNKTQKYLNVSSNSKKDVQNVMETYKATVQKHIDDANFTEEEVTVAGEAISKAEPIEESPIEEEITNRPSIPSNIMPGMWFQIFMGEDKVVRRCKLSVILVEDATLMFVNHKGELVSEKSFDEFNTEVANETTKVIMGHSAFENAFKTVINRLN